MKMYDDLIKNLYEKRQVEQRNSPNFNIIYTSEHGYHVGRVNGGIDWTETPEDHEFWSRLLGEGILSEEYALLLYEKENTISVFDL